MAERTCPTCGREVGEQMHLCAAAAAPAGAYVCTHCGRTEPDPRHVCFPKRVKVRFACGRCGRQAASSDALCQPKPAGGSGDREESAPEDQA